MLGDWFASSFIGTLVDKLCDYTGNQYEYQFCDAKEKLKQLEANLRMIQAVIHVAEARQIKNPRLADWLGLLKNAAFELDDVLDKFDYRVLEDRVLALNNQVRGSSSCAAAKRARRVFSRFLFSDEDLNELLEAVKKFDRIVYDMSILINLVHLDLVPKQDDEALDWRQTTSISEPNLFGRDNEKDDLVKLLLMPCDAVNSSSRSFSAASIVGMGGVGKTTLAQAAYNDPRVMSHFDLRAWVCVSNKFDVKRITVEIIESASIKRPKKFQNVHNLDIIQSILKKGLLRKRFLIVLDDVWNEASSKWNMLSRPFQFGKEGSIALITTRNQRIADMMGTKKTMELGGLRDEEYWPFFMECAFGDDRPFDHPKLLEIGREIAKKLGGSPLAAKTIGGALKSNLEEQHWRVILASKLWQVHQNEGDTLPALRLSYEHLPAHLKQCFAYCSIFPKYHCFEKDSLVQMWMALGFVQPNGTRRMEDIGGEYIDDLFSRFFFQNAAGGDGRFVIHDLLHDFAELVSTGEHFRIETDFSVEIPRGVHHLYVNATNLLRVYEFASEMKSLRSLVVFRELLLARSTFVQVLEEVLKELKGLRVLILHDLPLTILPEAIGNSVHLRYLEIQSSNAFELPKSLCRLYHLQGLNLKKSNNVLSQYWPLQPHPEAIRYLINLRYLKADPESVTAISGIGSLSSLQELDEFPVKKVRGFQIGELGKLRQLHGQLCIKNLENVSRETEAQDAGLDDKEHLKKLSLCWGHQREGDISTCKHEATLEGLKPHQELIELSITRYMGAKSPSWLQRPWASNLELIELSHCDRWAVLPPLGQLPFLRVLHLGGMRSVEHIGAEFYGSAVTAFPSLEELRLEDMPEWKDWSSIEPLRNLFPSLGRLCIRNCYKLRGPLPMPTSPKEISIVVSDKISSPTAHDKKRRLCGRQAPTLELITDRMWMVSQCIPAASLGLLHGLEISSYFLTSFTPEKEEWLRSLTSLRHLRFLECNSMNSLPAELKSVTSLETLCVKKCPNIKSLPEHGLPAGVKELHISDCNWALKERCSWRNGADWHKISHIQTITIEGEDATGIPCSLTQSPP